MHKCPNCGQEYEGNFCPSCGAKWQEEKICPKCGAHLAGSARFCNQCGYSFTGEAGAKPKEPSAFRQKASKAGRWIKTHLKVVIPVALLLVVAIVLLSLIPTFIAMQTNGTYYKLKSNGELDKETYFILSYGTWKDEDGESGSYTIDGENITFTFTFFGESGQIKGTIKNNVLELEGDTFISDKHRHNFSEWETTREATCQQTGSEKRTCKDCGIIEIQTTAIVPHNYVWHNDENEHWKECSYCGLEADRATHVGDSCTVCKPLGYELNYNKDGYTVIGANKELTEIEIPATYNNLPVTSIGSYALRGCSSLTSVTIPNSVTSIGDVAFCGCSSLTSITIPDSVTSIGSSAFIDCTSLTSVTIPDSVTSIGRFAFNGCSLLTSITIPDSVTSIGINAFNGCSSLSSVTIPDSVTSIDEFAFSSCTSLTSITIPDSVTSIGGSAFRDCSSLASITIPDSVTSISDSAFRDCSSLTSVTIPDSVTSIGSNAFNRCTSLTSITIPDSVTSIGDDAFGYCSSLSNIDFKGTKAQWKAIEKRYVYVNDYTGNFTVQCTDGKLDKNENEIN